MSKFTWGESAMEEQLRLQVRKRSSGLELMKQLHSWCFFFYVVVFQTEGAAAVQDVYVEKLVPVRGKHCKVNKGRNSVFPPDRPLLTVPHLRHRRIVSRRVGFVPEELLPDVHRHHHLDQSWGAVPSTRSSPGGSEQRGGTGEVQV